MKIELTKNEVMILLNAVITYQDKKNIDFIDSISSLEHINSITKKLNIIRNKLEDLLEVNV